MKTIFSLNDIEIPNFLIKDFHIISDLYTLTPTITIAINNEEFLKKALPGSELRIDFYTDEDQPYADTSFYIPSIEATPSEGTRNPGILDYIILKGRLLTELGENRSRAFFGSISSIVSSAAADEGYNNLFIENSSDISRTRYQIEESTSSFFERIKRYAIDQTSPMYLFTDLLGNLFLKSRRTFTSASIKYQLETIDSSGGQISYPLLIVFSLSLSSNSPDVSHSRLGYFTPEAFLDKEGIPEKIELPGLSYFEMNKSRVNYGWSMNPYEAAALTINDHFYKEDRLQELIAITPIMTSIMLGDLVYIRSTAKPGIYMVTYLDFLRNDGQELTKIAMTYLRNE